MAVEPIDHIILAGTTFPCDGIQAGKSVSEFTAGLKIGRATSDDRQHAFYNDFDDFSGGFGFRQLDIREALGTHWDNPGGVDLRRPRHITLPPKRYTVQASANPVKMILSSEILDGAALGVPREDPGAGFSDYFYYGAGDTIYRMDNTRNTLTLVKRLSFAVGPVSGSAANEPEKMTRMFLFRGTDKIRRLHIVTANSNVAGSSSKMFYSSDPGAVTPTWLESFRAAWDAIPAPFGPGGNSIVIAQAITFEFMFSANPTNGATDWNTNDADAAINAPLWIPNSICRFLGVAELPNSATPGLYFIDYGDGKLYVLNFYIRKAFPIDLGDFHYIINGCIWHGSVAVTDGWDVWLYSPGGGAETVRQIGLFTKDGVPDSLRAGRYRVVGLLDGGDLLFAIAERTALGKAAATSTMGFIIFVYNGTGWSQYEPAFEAAATSTTLAVNPITAVIDRFPSGVAVAQNLASQTSRSLNILCQAHPTNSFLTVLHVHAWPQIGKIPIDGVDEFDALGAGNTFLTGWLNGGFSDIYGVLHYMKVDLQTVGGTGASVTVEYRLDDVETEAAFVTLGTVSALQTDGSAAVLQFDATNKAGIKFRTVQFRIRLSRGLCTTLSGGINDSVATIPVAELSSIPDLGVIDIDGEVIAFTARSASSGAGNLTGATRGQRGSTAASHIAGRPVLALNRTPELRGLTLVYGKKAPLRKTWVVQVDVNKMVEQATLVDVNLDGTPEVAATQQNVWDYLEDLWNTQTLLQLTVPQAESSGNNLRVQIADMTKAQDDNRVAPTIRGKINLVLIEPVRSVPA